MFSADLAIDLARFDPMRGWSTEDLHMLADLIVTAMLATIVELLEARPGDDELIVKLAEKRLRLILLGVPHWKSD